MEREDVEYLLPDAGFAH